MPKKPEEPLVDLRKYVPGVKIALDPARLKIEKTAYVRRSVAKKLAQAQKLLPRGYHFIVRDAWRPAYVQAEIFFSFVKRLGTKQAKRYVAPWKGRWASGHMTGAALDVRILDARGRRLPMRSKKLTYHENAAPDHPKLPALQKKNRKLLRDVMGAVGFSNMPIEFWHWSYGDIHWAKREKKGKPMFGVVSDHRQMYANRTCPCGSGKRFTECHGV